MASVRRRWATLLPPAIVGASGQLFLLGLRRNGGAMAAPVTEQNVSAALS